MLPYKRSERVSVLIQSCLADIIRDIKELNPPLLTVSKVALSDDLLNCKIYYSVLGGADSIAAAKQILQTKQKQIRHQLAVRLNLRRTPDIMFCYDNTNENADKIFGILKTLENEQQSNAQ